MSGCGRPTPITTWSPHGRRPGRPPGDPLAGYAVGGGEGTVGLAGVLGVVVTLVVAGALFWVLRRRDPR